MSYQQSSPPNAQAPVRPSWKKASWSDPAQIAANQQGIVTQEQRILLDKGPGCFSCLIFILFVYSILSTCITTGVAIYALFTGGLIVFENSKVFILVIPLVLTVVLGKLSSVLRRAHQKRFQRTADALIIERVQGEIIWQNEQYIVHTPHFQLTTTSKSPPLPPPGPYHFYYTSMEKILLSAQPIHTNTQAFAQPGTLAATGLPGDEQARLALQLALCDTLDFSLADLDANRRGMLSNVQRRRLSANYYWSIIGNVIGFLVSGSLMLLLVVGIGRGWITLGGETDVPLFVLIIGFFVLLLLVLATLRGLTVGARKRYAEIWYAPVQNIEDNLQTRDASSGDSDIYYYDIGQLHFKVPEWAFKALMSGMRCRVYYLVSSKTLLSVEPLEVPVR